MSHFITKRQLLGGRVFLARAVNPRKDFHQISNKAGNFTFDNSIVSFDDITLKWDMNLKVLVYDCKQKTKWSFTIAGTTNVAELISSFAAVMPANHVNQILYMAGYAASKQHVVAPDHVLLVHMCVVLL